jgi:hypothetical protein
MCASRGPGRAKLRALANKPVQLQGEVYEKGLPRAKPRRQSEHAFHCQVARYLSQALPEGFWWTTFPAGGGGYRRGVKLKAAGLKPGVPDLVVFGPWLRNLGEAGNTLWLELKAKDGSLSQVQKDCHAQLKALGHTVETVKTLEQVEAALAEFVFPEKIRCSLS